MKNPSYTFRFIACIMIIILTGGLLLADETKVSVNVSRQELSLRERFEQGVGRVFVNLHGGLGEGGGKLPQHLRQEVGCDRGNRPDAEAAALAVVSDLGLGVGEDGKHLPGP